MRVSLFISVPFLALLATGPAAAQSNPYVAVDRFESGMASGWILNNAHLAIPGECGNPTHVLALNDGPGSCLFGALANGQEYSVRLPGLQFHPTQTMEFFFDYKNDLPTPGFVEIAGYGVPFGSFVVDFTNNTGGNDGNWHEDSHTVWPVPAGAHGAAYTLVVRVWEPTYTPGSGGYYFDSLVVRPRGNGSVFCDGSGCPCLNNAHSGGPEGGCRNSTGKGAWLSGYGLRSIATDEIEFVAAGLLPGQPAWLFQGATKLNGGNGTPFGNGLLCVGGGLQRLGIMVPDSSGIATWRNMAGPAGWSAGQTALMQVYYRDPLGNSCGADFNTTNGYELTLSP